MGTMRIRGHQLELCSLQRRVNSANSELEEAVGLSFYGLVSGTISKQLGSV
jgi:hypothetical protein